MEKLKEYYQEKENIYIYSGNAEKYYRINMNTGEMFGQIGRKLTSPKQITNALEGYLRSNYLPLTLALAVGACELCSLVPYPEEADTISLSNSLTTFYSVVGEEATKLRVSLLRSWVTYLRDFAPYTKHFKEIWELTGKKYNNPSIYSKFNNWFNEMNRYITGCLIFGCSSEDIKNLMPEEYHGSFDRFTRNLRLTHLSKEETDTILYYGVKQKIFSPALVNTYLIKYLADYISYCRDIDKKPVKTASFTREFVETYQAWSILKTEIDKKKIVNNYARRAKFWDFSYGDFIVKIPTCGEDLVKEGQRMHHCVGNYVNKIVDGSTYICFIRHKDNPDKQYITCQVNPNTGKIGQYYLACDELISSKKDIEFRKAYQEYLFNCHKEYKIKELA